MFLAFGFGLLSVGVTDAIYVEADGVGRFVHGSETCGISLLVDIYLKLSICSTQALVIPQKVSD